MENYLLVLIKFIIGFSIVISHMNLMGKTQLSQMTPVDFVGNFVLGGIIGGVIYNTDIPLTQYIIVLFIGVGLISLLNFLAKHFSFFRTVAIGEPIILIRNGEFIMDNVLNKENKIDIINISSRLHVQGIKSFKDVYFLQIEPDGALTIVTDKEDMPSSILVKSGDIRKLELERIEKDEEWLKRQLKNANIDNIEDIYLGEYCGGEINFIKKDGIIHQ